MGENVIIEAMVCQVCHTVYPFAHTALLANALSSDSLCWFEASDLCYSYQY